MYVCTARRRGGTRRKAESVCSPPLISPYVRRCGSSTLLLSPVGARAAPLDVRLRVLRVVLLVPLRALVPEDQRVRFMRCACVGRRQTVQVLPTFYALSRRRATELTFLGAVMVFLVFLEVLQSQSGSRYCTRTAIGWPVEGDRVIVVVRCGSSSPSRAAGPVQTRRMSRRATRSSAPPELELCVSRVSRPC